MYSLKHKLANAVFKRPIALFDALNWNARYLQWLRESGASGKRASRSDLYQAVSADLTAPIDYLEFGVYRGESLRQWLALNSHAESRFFGFDTFTGLPESWLSMERGTFNTDGCTPATADPRVTFVKGLFQDTVPGFLKTFVPGKQVVVHIDSDLFTSAQYVLAKMDAILVPGSIVLFDEFSCVEDEFRAWSQYLRAFCRKAEFLDGTQGLQQAAFRIVA